VKQRRSPALAGLALAAAATMAAELPGPGDTEAVANAVALAVGRVEYTLRYDRGAAPETQVWNPRDQTWGPRCPSCGQYHKAHLGDLLDSQLPLEAPAFLISPTHVLTRDVCLHPRFIERTAVRIGEEVVPARLSRHPLAEEGVILELEKPFRKAKSLTFQRDNPGPYAGVSCAYWDGSLIPLVRPVFDFLALPGPGEWFRPVPIYSLITDWKGVAVGASMNGQLALDDSWKGSPLDWPAWSAEQVAEALRRLEAQVDQALLPVTLRFRSPRKQTRDHWVRDGVTEVERHVVGVLVEPRRILVLANLSPKRTARLERIMVHPPGSAAAPATFAGSLRDFGALLADLERPLAGAFALADEKPTVHRRRLLLAARINVFGDNRAAYFMPVRLVAYHSNRQGMACPVLPQNDAYVFTRDRQLLCVPLQSRDAGFWPEPMMQDEAPGTPTCVPARYVKEILRDPSAALDPENRPRPEADEHWLAWIGVQLQPLSQELARAHRVSHLTNDGTTGALVSYVHPGSPADEAGIRVGFILLRLRVEGRAKPLDMHQTFPFLHTPWPCAENNLTRTLTDIGLGRRYTAELFHDGQPFERELEIVRGPQHFGSAPRHKSAPLGLTVCNLTYEVRHYYQRKPEEAGVVVCDVEPGGRAAVAGMTPFELVTHVQDQPVKNVSDFEELIREREHVSLRVQSLTRSRLLEIRPAPPAAGDEAAPGGDE